MCEDRIIETIEMECPICGRVHSVEKHIRQTKMLVKDEPVNYEQVYFLCTINRNSDYCEFVPAQVMDDNLLVARNAYREAHGLLTSQDIKDIRHMYRLSQSELSLILGMGEVTISRFETKSIQTKVLDEVLREARDNKKSFLKKLLAKRDAFSPERFEEIETHILGLVKDEDMVINVQSITFSQLREGILNKYKAFERYTIIETISSDYDLLPLVHNVSTENVSYYKQAPCPDNEASFVAA